MSEAGFILARVLAAVQASVTEPCPNCHRVKFFVQPDGRKKCRHCARIYGNPKSKEGGEFKT